MSEHYRIGFLLNFDVLPSDIPRTNPDRMKIFDEETQLINNGINFDEFGFVLRPIKKEDIDKLTSVYGFEVAKTRIDNFVLEADLSKERYNLYDFIIALKLLKEGNVYLSDIISKFGYALVSFPPHIPKRYIVHYNELEEIKMILKNIEKCNKILKYKAALHYFDKSYYDSYFLLTDYDVLIYLMMCAESLFLDGKEYRDTGSIIGMGCSMLIGENENERDKIKQNFEVSYKVRNIIVHSKDFGSVKDEKMIEYYKNIKDKNIEIREYLRKSIIKLIC